MDAKDLLLVGWDGQEYVALQAGRSGLSAVVGFGRTRYHAKQAALAINAHLRPSDIVTKAVWS